MLLTAGSCQNSYSVFSTRFPVNFFFDPTLPPYNAVTSFGVFISVRSSGNELIVTDASGKVTRWPMSEMESRSFLFGCGGLIIGTPSLDNDGCYIYAYDLACPVCDRASARLKLTTDGKAKCPDCGTEYNLNNNGFVITSQQEQNRPLFRYPVSQTSLTVTVSNLNL